MIVPIIRIGKSRVVELPQRWLDALSIGENVELELRADGIHIRPIPSARAGWEAALQTMAARGDDHLIDEEVATNFDSSEWHWD